MATSPAADRPHMPGYGIGGPKQGTGLLPWSWARQRLAGSRNYWLATVWPDGRPHVMPVWGIWHDDALWFSSGLRSRKARNLEGEPRCSAATEDPDDPVVVDGVAAVRSAPDQLAWFTAASNAKYATDYPVSFYDPAVNGVYQLAPLQVIGLAQEDFTGSPTRWRFG